MKPPLLLILLILGLLINLSAQAGVTVTYIHNDALGSPVAGTDEQGNLKWRSRYLPYGEETLGERGAFGERTGYTGHRDDPETGLVYMGARYYSPVLGRFMAVDPAGVSEGDVHSFNRYAYANDNPYKFVDPDGQESREAAFRELGLEDPAAGLTNRARQVAEGAAAVGEAIDDQATDVTNYIPVGIFAGVLKKLGGVVTSADKAFSKEKQALVDMAKSDKRAGATRADMKAYEELNEGLTDPFPANKVRVDEGHAGGGPHSQMPHGHVGPIEHIPIVDP